MSWRISIRNEHNYEKVNDDYKNQKMNEKQKDIWISVDEIKERYNALSLL